VAKAEDLGPQNLLKQVASGHAVVMQRDGRQPVVVGECLRTKINANIGTTAEVFDIEEEIKKAKIAGKYGADTIHDPMERTGPQDEED
jgi:phosphomethylpyrimidine synthase